MYYGSIFAPKIEITQVFSKNPGFLRDNPGYLRDKPGFLRDNPGFLRENLSFFSNTGCFIDCDTKRKRNSLE